MKIFGFGYKYQGSGPITNGKINRSYKRQKNIFSYILWLSRHQILGYSCYCYLDYHTEVTQRFLLSYQKNPPMLGIF